MPSGPGNILSFSICSIQMFYLPQLPTHALNLLVQVSLAVIYSPSEDRCNEIVCFLIYHILFEFSFHSLILQCFNSFFGQFPVVNIHEESLVVGFYMSSQVLLKFSPPSLPTIFFILQVSLFLIMSIFLSFWTQLLSLLQPKSDNCQLHFPSTLLTSLCG